VITTVDIAYLLLFSLVYIGPLVRGRLKKAAAKSSSL
jgi:hypothetical protein